MTDSDDPNLLLAPADGGTGAEKTDAQPAKSRRWPWVLVGLIVAVPVLLTLAGALTSPPHAKGVPVGHLIYLEADEPSDHTSLLRGLRIMGQDGRSQQLLHETEPQDTDSGSREWITQPKASPRGNWLAFEMQIITLQEEKQGIENQLWVLPLNDAKPQPRMLLDLTQKHLKQFVGLTWSANDERLSFLEDGQAISLQMVHGGVPETETPIKGVPPLKTSPNISATRNPDSTPGGEVSYQAVTPQGMQTIIGGHPVANVSVFAVSLDGKRTAEVTSGEPAVIVVQDGAGVRRLPVRWGWSALGKRRITMLRWSPNGAYLAYSVSKPPLEDEVFYVDPATGKCSQLPVRTGQAGWDWAR